MASIGLRLVPLFSGAGVGELRSYFHRFPPRSRLLINWARSREVLDGVGHVPRGAFLFPGKVGDGGGDPGDAVEGVGGEAQGRRPTALTGANGPKGCESASAAVTRTYGSPGPRSGCSFSSRSHGMPIAWLDAEETGRIVAHQVAQLLDDEVEVALAPLGGGEARVPVHPWVAARIGQLVSRHDAVIERND